MGCSGSRDHPKNVELLKFKRKYNPQLIKSANMINIWVIGGDKVKTLELAKMIADKQGYLLLTEQYLLQKEAGSGSERGLIINEIVNDKGTVFQGIVDDLMIEALVDKLKTINGIVFHGIPRDKEHACHVQNIMGQATLVIYCELMGDKLKQALFEEGDDAATMKNKVDHFQKSVVQLSKHKNTVKVNGEARPSEIFDECVNKLNKILLQ